METGEQASSSQLHGAYDSTYLLRLVQAEHSQSGVYSFETCLHTDGIATEQSCVPTFKNKANQAVQITLNTIENNQLTPQESQHIAFMSQEYAQYHNQIKLNSAPVSNTIAIGLGGTAGGIGGHYAFKKFAHRVVPNPTDTEAQILELDTIIKRGTANAEDPLTTIRSMIDQEATETVFEPKMISFLDNVGLPAEMRSWLRINKLSSGHYLLNPSKFFDHLLTKNQQAEFKKAFGSMEKFKSIIHKKMTLWMLDEYNKIDAMMIFKPQFRELIGNHFVRTYNYYFEPMTKWTGKNYVTLDNPPKNIVADFILGFTKTNHPFEYGNLQSFAVKMDAQSAIFGLENHTDAFLKFHPDSGQNLLEAYRKITKLTPISPKRLNTLKIMQDIYEPPFNKGVLGFLAKHKGAAAGAAAGVVITAVVMGFSDAAHSKENSQTSSHPFEHDGGDLTLIMDLSNALWSSNPADQVAVSSVEEMIKNIVMFQHKVWLDGENSQAAMIDQYCLPSLNNFQHNHKVCFST